jgi:hypothetical protein
MMGMRPMGGSTPATAGVSGGARSVPFSRLVTVADSSFATTTVTLPRSSKPIKIVLAVTASAAIVQVQGNGPEVYSVTVSNTMPSVLDLTGFPETTTVGVQSEILGAATLTGSVFYA